MRRNDGVRLQVVAAPTRLAAWFRRDYPTAAPMRGHNYLLALCWADVAR